MREGKLSEFIKIIGGGTPNRSKKDYWNGNIPWVSIDDFKGDERFIENSKEKISDLGLKNSSTKLLKKNSIIISARGTVGKIIQLKKDMAFNQSCYGLEANEEFLSNDFLYFLLKYHLTRISSLTHGTTFNTIIRSTFDQIVVKIPSKEHQKKILKILNNIDYKLANNKKINTNLELIIKQLFKSWFLDFDPVKAKVENKKNNLTKDIQNLFPDKLTSSNLGEKPKGWRVVRLDSLLKRINDKFYKNEDWEKEKLIDLSRMPSNSISIYNSGFGDELSTSVRKFKKYDFLFGSIRPYFNKAGICPFNGVTNTSVFILSVINKDYREFLYSYLFSDLIFKKSVQFSKGTKMPIISWNDFKNFELILPQENVIKKFSEITKPFFEKILLNISEYKILHKLKYELVPIINELQ